MILKLTDQGAPAYNGEAYPAWAQGVAWTIALLPIVVVLVVMVVVAFQRGGWKVRVIHTQFRFINGLMSRVGLMSEA